MLDRMASLLVHS